MPDAMPDRAGPRRRPVIGVMGSGTEPHADLAAPLGAWIARIGFHLLTGGGGGAMAEVARAFAAVRPREGLVVGVVPGTVEVASAPGDRLALSHAPRPGYPNEHVELAIVTHLPDSGEAGTLPTSRNHVNVLSSDVVVALPGGAGTRSEMVLALAYGRPVVALVGPGADPADLPAGVALARDLAGVERFVLGALGGRAGGPG